MMKRFFTFLLMLFPVLVFADETISFAPPATDYSVSWLANIFGVVDGVLHGTGSQIVGRMFSVFNAAVMALGGIIITYTMLVSTMNTAHEGEMLGKKWSSIWVPVRATAGFALLVPKASGYCLLQVFVMWVVVQGVGAADKLWDAALGYLNRGGVIIQAQQQDPTAGMVGATAYTNLQDGAISILSGQVCMLAVEKILKNKYAQYKNTNGQPGSSKCSRNIMGNSGLEAFCAAGAVPSFSDSIDFKKANDQGTPIQYMPNFDKTTQPFYSQFNGICGKIEWNLMDVSAITTNVQVNENEKSVSETTGLGAGLTQGEYQVTKDARVIALQQMYGDLFLVAQVMINNDPDPLFSAASAASNPPPRSSAPPVNPMQAVDKAAANSASNAQPYKPWATDAFGQPLDQNNLPCASSGTPQCTNWGTLSGGGGSLLNGTELVGAVLDYSGIINPTLTLLKQAASSNVLSDKSFINNAKSSGWIMAGSYFFDLVRLNNKNVATSQSIQGDPNSGINASQFTLTDLNSGFPTAPPAAPTVEDCKVTTPSPSGLFCQVLEGDGAPLNAIYLLFTGTAPPSLLALPSSTNLKQGAYIPSIPMTSTPSGHPAAATSVFGYAQNSLVIQVPGQPKTPPLKFANMMHIDFSNTSFTMPPANFACMGIDLLFFKICLGRMIGNIIYNDIILLVLNTVVAWLESMVYGLVMNMLMIPLDAMAAIFTQGLRILDVQGINPIVALAQMGTYYINFVGKLWFMLLFNQLVGYIISLVGLPLVPIMMMAMPITIAWSLIMLGVGMITAYYIPLIPYMIFLFGAIAWFMAVIEAMVAAPIVALGVIHPEGHDIFGKGEAAIMILMNVFLRPAMMIIGFITAISLCYVGIWVLNAGFDHAVGFMQQGTSTCNQSQTAGAVTDDVLAGAAAGGPLGAAAAGGIAGGAGGKVSSALSGIAGASGGDTGLGCSEDEKFIDFGRSSPVPGAGEVEGGYTQWAGVFAFLFSILIYTTIYMTIVEKAFTLISALPDNILRWIGGHPERHGQEAAQWAGEAKKGVEKAESDSQKAMLQAGKAAQAAAPSGSEGSIEAGQGTPPSTPP